MINDVTFFLISSIHNTIGRLVYHAVKRMWSEGSVVRRYLEIEKVGKKVRCHFHLIFSIYNAISRFICVKYRQGKRMWSELPLKHRYLES